ncbi:MAG TPA: dephospho-CoA kinase [Euryarchaeota archaeon]|nr:dephospho-CoA kinase [Euryarchaeota archaeon]
MFIITTGMPGSGKDELLKVFQQAGLFVARMGDVVRSHAMESGALGDDFSVGSHANSQRERFGQDIWAARTLELLCKEHDNLSDLNIVIDGSRSLFELEYFKKHLPKNVIVVAVHATSQERFKRLKKRARADAPDDYETFTAREERELGWGLGEIIKEADIIIDNNGTLEEFVKNVHEVADSLLKGDN